MSVVILMVCIVTAFFMILVSALILRPDMFYCDTNSNWSKIACYEREPMTPTDIYREEM